MATKPARLLVSSVAAEETPDILSGFGSRFPNRKHFRRAGFGDPDLPHGRPSDVVGDFAACPDDRSVARLGGRDARYGWALILPECAVSSVLMPDEWSDNSVETAFEEDIEACAKVTPDDQLDQLEEAAFLHPHQAVGGNEGEIRHKKHQ
jgi:hypothetical protein